ncbi:MAG: hypothetical protein RIB45_11045 [Marivibrio sp.]|uniref:hypothetical protein n=1 Tax=Marivibrio sp. TaxID=2039719 RepID=UPI0032EFC9B1
MGKRRAGLLAAIALLASGCLGTDMRGMVAREWSRDMRALQINAVFPPREDFQVGDLYLAPVPPDQHEDVADEGGYAPLASWVGSIDFSRELLAFYSTRRAYPATPPNQSQEAAQPTLDCAAANLPALNAAPGAQAAADALNAADGGAETAETAPTDGVVQGAAASLCNSFTSPQARSVDRMRLVAFPDFSKTTVTEGDLSGLIPVEALTVAFGARSRETRSVTFSVPIAESVGLPLSRVATKLTAEAENAAMCPLYIRALPKKQREEFLKTQIFHLTAVTEVFYARSIDVAVTFEEQDGVGLDLGLADPTGTAAGQQGSVTQEPLLPPSESDQSTAEAQDEGDRPSGAMTLAEAQKRIDALNRALSASLERGGPGGGLKVLSLSAGSIGMRRSFSQPVAIGYRGVNLAVKSTPGSDGEPTCAVVGSGPADGDLPKDIDAAAG